MRITSLLSCRPSLSIVAVSACVATALRAQPAPLVLPDNMGCTPRSEIADSVRQAPRLTGSTTTHYMNGVMSLESRGPIKFITFDTRPGEWIDISLSTAGWFPVLELGAMGCDGKMMVAGAGVMAPGTQSGGSLLLSFQAGSSTRAFVSVWSRGSVGSSFSISRGNVFGATDRSVWHFVPHPDVAEAFARNNERARAARARGEDNTATTSSAATSSATTFRGARALPRDQVIRGQLTSDDPLAADGTHFHAYEFTASAGEELLMTMQSTAVDSYIILARLTGNGNVQQVASDDDALGNNNSAILHRFAESGRYALLVSTVGRSTGGYAVALATRESFESRGQGRTWELLRANATGQRSGGTRTGGTSTGGGMSNANGGESRAASAVNGRIERGQELRGEITGSDPLASDNTPYDEYAFTASAGDDIEFEMRSGDVDSYLVLGRMQNGQFQRIETDDDSGGGRNAKLRYRITSSGEYRIRANTVGRDERGRYTLLMR
jgi:hypothetical protein